MLINRWSDEIDSPNNEPIYCGDPSKEVWIMRDGAQIQVGAMTELHLKNCWKMVEGKSIFWEQVFEAETKKRTKKWYKK
jgi:hypothetical protein